MSDEVSKRQDKMKDNAIQVQISSKSKLKIRQIATKLSNQYVAVTVVCLSTVKCFIVSSRWVIIKIFHLSQKEVFLMVSHSTRLAAIFLQIKIKYHN